ncbi:nuclear pore complex protein Nup133 [Ischnura elegans]|uniref:nuclear pore complex protein Nup133 n=1 Tax=Ischnura elegans TaxID=197161 RepID=UPI001ED89DC8|nr:nuclear pore complex protein Nup133 [Ischnura elegans]
MEWNQSMPKSLNLSAVSTRSPLQSKRSFPSFTRKSSRSSVGFRSSQPRKVVAVTQRHVVESCGASLPVLVAEALGYADRSASGSVRISPSGWAWLVTGRRLFVWQYRQLSSAGSVHESRRWNVAAGQCRELNLPPSDLSHKADLVCVITNEGNHFPSCVAVTPEGTVRYWPSIAHEGTSVEDNADLQGQECDSLTYLGPHGCLLATTTSTIVLVVPQMIDGRHSIFCRALKTPQGWLGGISRRFSSLIFGSMTASQVMEVRISRVIAVCPTQVDGGSSIHSPWKVYLLTGHSLQHWMIGATEQLIAEYDLDRITQDSFQQTIWRVESGGESKVWLMDMQLIEGGFMVLAAAVNPSCSSLMHYAFGTIFTDEASTSPVKFASFCPIKYTSLYREDEELKSWNYHFILHGNNVIMFNFKNIIAVPVSSPSEDPDKLEFMTSDDRVLGGALCGSVPLFFLKNHGLLSILPIESTSVDAFNNSIMEDSNVSEQSLLFSDGLTVSMAELEEMSVNKDSTTKLKAAFLNYVRKDRAKCEALLQDLFSESAMGRSSRLEVSGKPDVDRPLDQVVVSASLNIIDEVPDGDPRWSDSKQSTVSLKTSSSLQILNQLQGKQKALEIYLDFLKAMQLWEKLSGLSVGGRVVSTCHVLAEHEEKLVAAISLKTLHPVHNALLDPVIKRVQVDRGMLTDGCLTHIDLFFKEVSKVHEAIPVLCQYSEEVVQSSRPPDEIASTLAEANTIILTVLQDVMNFRKQNDRSPSPNFPGMEYLPWTASSGKAGVGDALVLQHSITLKNGAQLAGNPSLRNQLYDQLVSLVDIILDGCRSHLESIKGSGKYPSCLQQYEVKRSSYIKSFFDEKEYERAAVLAEKFCDFEALVRVCDITGNDERLSEYQEKFEDQGFSNFLYAWYMREHKQGELLEKFRQGSSLRKVQAEGMMLKPLDGGNRLAFSSAFGQRPSRPLTVGGDKPFRRESQREALGSFLSNHPSISWMLNVFDGETVKASDTLRMLASQEKESITKKKYMLSMAKLALLANGNVAARGAAMDWINNQMNLIESQENLPESTVYSFGYEPDKMPVLTPAEIIKLYIADECEEATEYEFSKALDLLPMIENNEEREELWLTVWCRAILRDKWLDVDSCVPVETCQRKLFFKLVELSLLMGKTPLEVLPPVDKIMAMEELGTLRESKSFQYLLRIGYEHYSGL